MKKVIILIAVTSLFVNGVYGQSSIKEHVAVKRADISYNINQFKPGFLRQFSGDGLGTTIGNNGSVQSEVAFVFPKLEHNNLELVLTSEISFLEQETTFILKYNGKRTSITHSTLYVGNGLGIHYNIPIAKFLGINIGYNLKATQIEILGKSEDYYESITNDPNDIPEPLFTITNYRLISNGASVALNIYPAKEKKLGVHISYSIDTFYGEKEDLKNIDKHSVSIGISYIIPN